MDEAPIKLAKFRADILSSTIPSRQNSMSAHTECSISVDHLQGPPHISTKGLPMKRRLGAELDKSIKSVAKRKKKNPRLDAVDIAESSNLTQDSLTNLSSIGESHGVNDSQHLEGFMSLLKSFHTS
ncbi:hypothetical protein PIB30_052494 [Stylosanthes scabra]|uniref:Uncharacterized protein n=1 Tax=Stylosanthes scabra TaxID=79078 RepID=A0ABU6UJ17_9FABA|nr:hypothetical protein [Stylosanthes scabra]